MKKVLFLLALVAGIAMAEEQEEAAEEARGGPLKVFKTAALASILGPLGVLIEIGLQVVILIALIMFISSLKANVGDIGSIFGKGEEEYGYYPSGGYDVGVSGSSYVSTGPAHGGGGGGYHKRSADSDSVSSTRGDGRNKRSTNSGSIMDLPVGQRLAARVHDALDNFNY